MDASLYLRGASIFFWSGFCYTVFGTHGTVPEQIMRNGGASPGRRTSIADIFRKKNQSRRNDRMDKNEKNTRPMCRL